MERDFRSEAKECPSLIAGSRNKTLVGYLPEKMPQTILRSSYIIYFMENKLKTRFVESFWDCLDKVLLAEVLLMAILTLMLLIKISV